MTLVLLDTNAYLRLAKRVRPLLGKPFGDKGYVVTILRDVEDEVRRSSALRFKFPWFDEPDFSAERLSAQVRLSSSEKLTISTAQSILRGTVLSDVTRYCQDGSPPSAVDCFVLAFGQIRPAIVVTDDIGMHLLAKDFDIPIWHGYELLAKMRTHKVVDNDLVREIYDALERNGDMTSSWARARHTTFVKVFGKAPPA